MANTTTVPSLTPKDVEMWLTSNPGWLQGYVTEKLDRSLVESWFQIRKAPLSNGTRPIKDSSSCDASPNGSPLKIIDTSTVFFPTFDRENRLASAIRKGRRFTESSFFPPSKDSAHSDINTSSTKVSLTESGGFRESHCGNQRSNSKKYLRQNFARSRIRGLLKAHEPSVSFERDSTLAERRSSLKGMRQFLSLPPSPGPTLSMLIQSKVRMPPRYASKNEDLKRRLRLQNERDFFLEIVRDVTNDLDMNSLTGSILVNVSILVLAESCSLFFVEGPPGARRLVSKTFSADAESDCLTVVRGEPVGGKGSPWGTGIIGHVAETKSTVNIKNPGQDPRYKEDLARTLRLQGPFEASEESRDQGCGAGAGEAPLLVASRRVTRLAPASLLCLPICNTDGDVVAVAQVLNKSATSGGSSFTEDDEKLLETYTAFCGMAISNAQAIEAYSREYDRNKALLEVVHDLFEQQTSVNAVVTKIMQRAQTLLNCERCVVMLEDNLDNSSNISETCRLFDLQQPKCDSSQNTVSSAVFHLDVRSPEQSPSAGEMINLSHQQLESIYAVAHDLTGVSANGILCKPIRNSKFQTIGAAQLINKLEGGQFDENDERLFEAFTIFCGLGINNCLLFDEIARAAAKQAVSLEVLSYHATTPSDQVLRFKNSCVPSLSDLRIDNIDFCDFSLGSDEMIFASIRIFQEMGLIKRFKIDYETLIRWLLTVRKNYRNVAYHNWRHAFNVCQFMFAVLETCCLRKHFSDIECLALIVACLCHDLDHRGTNNAFQQKSSSALSQLYGTQATLEYHHFNHAVMILNSEGHNIFASLDSTDYGQVMNLLKHAILATDLTLHIQVRSKFFSLVESDTAELWVDPVNRATLRSIVMTTCDIATITKPWEVQLRAADLVIMEFFDQGDKEKTMLNLQPLAIMDRDRRDELPRLQIEWIDGICLPLYRSLAQIDDHFQSMLHNVVANREHWLQLQSNLDKHLKQTEV